MKIKPYCSMCTTKAIDTVLRMIRNIDSHILCPKILKVPGATTYRRWIVSMWQEEGATEPMEYKGLTNREAYYYFNGIADGATLVLNHNSLDTLKQQKEEIRTLRKELSKANDATMKAEFKFMHRDEGLDAWSENDELEKAIVADELREAKDKIADLEAIIYGRR